MRFRVLDYRGQPLAGVPVSFRLQGPVTGVSLTPASTTTLKGSGYAETQLTVPSRVASVIVVAKVGDREVLSAPISFAGAVPNGRQFTFQCGSVAGAASGGVHAIGAYDEARNLIAGVKLNCFAHVGDRNGDGLSGASVSFMTEAGTIGPSSTSTSDVVGNAQILFKTSKPEPVPTTPSDTGFTWNVPTNETENTGEYLVPLWMHPWEWNDRPFFNSNPITGLPVPNSREPRRNDPIVKCNNGQVPCVNNPRDRLVTMIAVTSGEEGFSDDNNNGVRDANEPYDDLTEPFVDSNDNGTRDASEPYIDVNGNTKWDGKNQTWDANTLIWTQERILWTGVPNRADSTSVDPIAKQAPIYINNAVAGLNVKYLQTFEAPIHFLLSDPWYNSIAQNGDGDGCELGGEEDADTQVVIATPKKINAGRAYTYPAFRFYEFFVRDARDPSKPPSELLPIRNPAIPFRLPIICTFTASPVEGQKVTVSLGMLEGTVE